MRQLRQTFLPRRAQKKLIALLTVLVMGGLLAVGQQFGWLQEPQQAALRADPGLYAVEHFVDGDTIAVNMNGTTEKVRMIGLDTPETHKPNAPVQCYGWEAAAYTKQLIGTGKVRLESDPQSSNRDRYGRLLRYVYLTDGRMVETELIQNGYGFAYTSFPFTKSAEFKSAEQQAQTTRKGLWAACQPTPNKYGGYTSNNL